MPEFSPTDANSFEYTAKANEIEELRNYAENGRHMIGRDTRISEGAWGGSYGGEVIVADYDKVSAFYDHYVDKVVAGATVPAPDSSAKIDKSRILKGVFNVVKDTMAYDQAGVDTIFNLAGGREYQKISLGAYIQRGKGVCRHQAMFAGLLLEKLGDRGIVSGKPSLDRNIQWPEQGDRGGHAWVRYTNGAGEVFIIDVAQNFIGSLEEATKRGNGWNYLRPEEQQQRQAIAKTAFRSRFAPPETGAA